MNCKKCGQVLVENIKFCGKCGEKVEEAIETIDLQSNNNISEKKVCEKCSGTIREGAKFCRQCGEPVSNDLPQASLISNMLPIIKDNLSKGINFIKKPVAKIVSGIILGFIILILCLNNMPQSTDRVENQLMLFQEEGEYYGKFLNKEKFSIGIEDRSTLIVTRDSKKVYFIEDGDLYVKEGEKDREKIASDVTSFTISPYGETIAYVKGEQYNVGELYVKTGKKEPEKISSQASSTIDISDNGRYVSFTEVEDLASMEEADGYIYELGKEKQKLNKAFPISVNNKGTVIGRNDEGTLYLIKKDREAEKVSDNVRQIIINRDLSKIAFLDDEGNLYIYDGKDKEKIDKNVTYISNYEGIKKGVYNNYSQLATKEIDLLYTKNSSIYFKIEGQEAEKIVSETVNYLVYSHDMRNFAYIDEGNLHIKQFNNKKIVFNEKIDSNVMNVDISGNGKHLTYIKTDDLYYIQLGNKKSEKVVADISRADVQNNGVVYFEDKDTTLYVTKNKKDKEKVVEDVQTWLTDSKGNLYAVDKDDILYGKRLNKKIQKISEEVSPDIDFRYMNTIFSSYTQY